MEYIIQKTTKQADYELLDSGNEEKLERYGEVILSRPDPQALWNKNLEATEWYKAGGVFSRQSKDAQWKMRTGVPEKWQIEFGGLKFWIRPTAFKHTGIFPEHLGNWEWIKNKIVSSCHPSDARSEYLCPTVIPVKTGIQSRNQRLDSPVLSRGNPRTLDPRFHGDDSEKRVKVLNLFGYTGGATLAAAQAGAEVVHVDGSKVAISWARDNAEISGLADKPIRWILDDAVKFVKREIKRGHKYDGIIMDPPAFGHGPTGETWKIEKNLVSFFADCFQILSDKPIFFLANGYASGYSAIAYANNLSSLVEKYGGQIEKGELTIEETGSGRLLPCGIFARWDSPLERGRGV